MTPKQRCAGLLGVLLSAWWLQGAPARACVTCVTGDPTLTSMGTQQPFAGRTRVALELSHRTERVGRAGINRTDVTDQRVTASMAYAPTRQWMFSLQVPGVRRHIGYVNLGSDTLVQVGDIELRARAFVYVDRDFAPRHLLGLVGGLKLPTAPLHEVDGQVAEPEVQSGNGSFDPLLGASYTFFAQPWSAFVSEVVYVPTPSRADWRVGVSWLGTHAVQYQLIDTLAFRLGANTRVDQATQRASGTEPDSGGFVLFAAPSLLYSPAMDLVLQAEISIPVAHRYRGQHDEGPVFVIGAAYDL